MDSMEQIQCFAASLDRLVEEFRTEWDLPSAAVLGVLSMKKTMLELEFIDNAAFEAEYEEEYPEAEDYNPLDEE